ncbi:pyruvate [Blastocystis sp. ATCC 50177/Nand II]|uniref:Pyruvate n=1 Tax=Blastocystis sp. subtype 1 (strain ATCC 50177 / NandII) TaxID=478820 RepID=A0A196S9L6_BLAHN|nr:pyruvate [Blastocystis sp. ATCC 50177/Nand II]
MGEHCDVWSSQGRKNIFGQPVKVIEMQSEAGAMGALHGALVGGILGTTFSSSQGLMLMIPDMLKVAGELLPGVIHVASRSVAKQTGCLYCDYSDVFTTRGTGFTYLSSHSVQEAHDLALVAHIAALENSYPILHFFDGFRTSHEVASIEMMTPDEVKKVYPFDKALEFKKRGLNPTHPEAIGVVEGGDTWMQHAMANGPLLEKIPENVQAAMDKVASVTGRQYHLFDYAGAADADRVIVVMGASASTVEETVNYLNQHGEKVGVMKVHLWRPFSLKHFAAALPKTVKKICVLDKTREDAAYGDPLYEDVCAVANDMEQKVTVVGGRFGVGGKQFTPTMAKAAFDNLKADKPRNHFCLGIVDDVCHSNLPLGPTLNVSPKHLKQCILYGLGSDGTVGATQEAVKLIVDNTKLNAQAYFGFDAHKSGGLTVTHLRFGPDKITSEYNIENADYIGCHATGYVSKFDMLQNIKEGGTFVLNAPWKTVEELEKNLPPALKHQIAEKKVKFYVIDASAVAQKVGLRQRINMGHLVDKTTVKGLAFQPPMLEFNGACAGCGEMTIVKMLTQLYGDRIMFADAMGCTMVSLGGTGVVPFTRNQRGHGPTWGCSLFEDNADYGYGMYKSQVVRRNKLTAYVEQALASSAPMSQELRAAMQKWYDHRDDADAAIASYDELLPLLAKEKDKAVEIKNVNDYADMLPLHTTWILGGDGWAYDIGFNALDHVMASGDNIKCMVVDTEMYANTGGQQSKATQLSAVAKFAAGGKRMMKKDLGKHMMGYKNVYVASIAVGADPRQAIKALIEAQTYNGPALVISYSPCQQHGFPSKLGMSHLAEEERKAVECGYWPLYRYDPRRAEKGENPFQLDFKKLKGKVVDYLNGQNRYSVLERQHPEVADKLHEELQVELEKRHAERVRMAMSDKQLWKELNKTYGKK